MTLSVAGDEWLRYGERDRKLRFSTVQDYRPRTINKRRDPLGFIVTFAQRRYGLTTNSMLDVDRQPERRSGDFDVLEPGEVELLSANAANEQDGVIFTVAAITGLRLGELSRSGGRTSTGP